MEKDPVVSEEKDESSENGREKAKVWFQENLRMIVSIVIVVVIAGGIYTYSKRAQAPIVKKGTSATEQSSEGKISVIGGDNESVSNANETGQTQQNAEQPPTQPAEKAPAVAPQTSQETEASFMETAAKGDGTTKLARRALANYLEKNPDSALTAEHKIFIEDLLRRQVQNGRLKIGDKREFSKDSIAKAIEKSKGLNTKQLKNLHKFSQKVSELK